VTWPVITLVALAAKRVLAVNPYLMLCDNQRAHAHTAPRSNISNVDDEEINLL
jgi:hypothetical protein